MLRETTVLFHSDIMFGRCAVLVRSSCRSPLQPKNRRLLCWNCPGGAGNSFFDLLSSRSGSVGLVLQLSGRSGNRASCSRDRVRRGCPASDAGTCNCRRKDPSSLRRDRAHLDTVRQALARGCRLLETCRSLRRTDLHAEHSINVRSRNVAASIRAVRFRKGSRH